MQLGVLCRERTSALVQWRHMATFGQRVRQAREYAGLSQAELAARLDVKQQAIAYLENPKKNAQASRHTSEIARACNVDAGWLAKEDGPAPGRAAREPTAAEYRTAGQKRARNDAEKLLALVQTFLNTDARGRGALYAQALAVSAADNEIAGTRTDRRARGKRG